MIKLYPASSRYTADHGWLRTSHSFSFADYYDPDNTHFGVLRVLNDDVVRPGAGFGMHPHRDMEIVSVVLQGQLLHRDSRGHEETITVGEIQRMSAGTGILHSEMNPSESEEVHFLQLWFFPERKGLEPSYERIAYPTDKMNNALLPVVSQRLRGHHIARIHQDVTLYLSNLEAGAKIAFSQEKGRRIFVFVIEGELLLNGEYGLERRDSARIIGVPDLTLSSDRGARFMLIDLP
jgi:redox-sensitive bicupin YhaK (pirin superfamily)